MAGKKSHKRSGMSRFRRYRRGGSRKPKFPIALGAGVGIGIGVSALGAWNESAAYSSNMGVRALSLLDGIGQRIYGYSAAQQKWQTGKLAQFWVPVGGGIVAHVIASKTGVNRLLAKHLGVVL